MKSTAGAKKLIVCPLLVVPHLFNASSKNDVEETAKNLNPSSDKQN